FWSSLLSGRDNSSAFDDVRAFLFHERGNTSVLGLLTDKLLTCYQAVRHDLKRDRPFGVILASTKGMSNDFVWHDENYPSDPLTPVLREFLRRTELEPKRALCVSNACSSSLAAMALAQKWMEQGLEQVLIVAADAVTPFVLKGFQSLKLVSA